MFLSNAFFACGVRRIPVRQQTDKGVKYLQKHQEIKESSALLPQEGKRSISIVLLIVLITRVL
jgi:hypothetical protein